MSTILNDIKISKDKGEKLLAVLIDPDKFNLAEITSFLNKINKTIVTHIFVGGSTVEANVTQQLVTALKKETTLPIVLFPGDVSQVSKNADAILFLSLLSGRNPNFLIEQHIKSVPLLEESNIEVIPTAYILIESGKETAVQRVTQTQPLKDMNTISQTAKAGEYLGMQLVYLEAGSGANYPVSEKIIKHTKQRLQIPLIVGGGIRTKEALNTAYNSGADLVVIGTAFEENSQFYREILK